MNKKSVYYKRGKKQIHIVELDRWIKINKPVRVAKDIPKKTVCSNCGARTLRTGNFITVQRIAVSCGGISVDQRRLSCIIRPRCGPLSPKFDHEYMLLMAWLGKNGYEPDRTICAETVSK